MGPQPYYAPTSTSAGPAGPQRAGSVQSTFQQLPHVNPHDVPS